MFTGYTVKNYEFIRLIGSGGMGEIWSARRTTLGDVVAIKILKAHKFEDLGKAFKNFEKEAQATSLINHPNVCKVYDFFEDNNTYFLVMEYLEGLDLSRVLHMNKALPDDNYKFALYVSRQVLRALNVAHNLNSPSVNKILHRDIKPANIFVTVHNEIKLLDLGIAKIETDFDSTRTTEIGYSKNYSSPDLWEGDVYKGERYAENHDLYSLSLVFREICQGRFPGIASSHFKSVFERWNAEKQGERIQTAGEVLREIEAECERLAVNDFIIRKVITFDRGNSIETIPASPVKRNAGIKTHAGKIFAAAGMIAITLGIAFVTRKDSIMPTGEFGIVYEERDWVLRLGPMSNSKFDLSAFKCRITPEKSEECSLRDGASESQAKGPGDEPGAKHLRIRMDDKKNISTIYYAVYGEEEGKTLVNNVRQNLKKHKYTYNSDINAYLAKDSLVTIYGVGLSHKSVTLEKSKLFDILKTDEPYKKTTQKLYKTQFSFTIPAEALQGVELGLFPDLYEKISPLGGCSNDSSTRVTCTLASNSTQELHNEDDILIQFSFEEGRPFFIQYSFRMDGVYSHMVNTLSQQTELVRGIQEESTKFWFSESEAVKLTKKTINKMQIYTLTVHEMGPLWIEEAINTGYVKLER